MKKTLFSIFVVLLTGHMVSATTYNCSTVSEIQTALSSVVAGDEIVIAAGTYVSSTATNASWFYASADGTEANPITIRSASSSDKAHLQGTSHSSGTVLRIEGDYWIVEDLEISTGLKGLVFDNSNYSQAINCDIHTVGNEAVHVRDGSDYVTIDGCNIYNTGNVNEGYGEGIYIGTDKGSWSSYDPYVNYTTVKNCMIGPNVRAEPLDIKEGTQETTVEYNTIDGTGISGSNYADSFIDLKGVRTYVRYNTFNQNSNSTITKGIAAIYRSVEISCYEHAIHNNVFNMDDSENNIVEAYSGTSDVYAWDNTRSPDGDMYNSRITESCPSWYSLCSGNSAPTVSITSPSNGSSITEGDTITISASASDSDGSILNVSFYHGTTLLAEDSSSPYEYTWSNIPAGSYDFTAVAMDDDSVITTSSSVSITVNTSSSNQTPVVSVTSPTDGSTYTAGDTITITVSASDNDGNIANVEFYEGTNYLGSDSTSPYEFEWTDATAGTYSITAIATDNESASTTSASISVTVNGTSSSGNLSIAYECGDETTDNNKIKPYVQIVNDGSSSVLLEDLTLRYWFTMEGTSTPTFTCDYAAIGETNVSGSFTNTSGLDYYLEVSFNSSAGSIAANDNSGSIKLRINKSDWSNHDETNDYSFDSSYTSFSEYEYITLYQNGTLIWGIEPSSSARVSTEVEEMEEQQLVIYPNPAVDELKLSLPDNMEDGAITIISLSGQRVLTENLPNHNGILNIANLVKGLYIIKVSQGKKIYTQKFSKQ